MQKGGTRSDDSVQPGAASRQDVPDAARVVMRLALKVLSRARRARQNLAERVRALRGAPHVVHFFHQVDDPYSELAIQASAELAERYAIELRFHLVGQADRVYVPEPEMLAAYARRDCATVAPHYGLAFPDEPAPPAADRVLRVEALLANLCDDPRFLDVAREAGRALWSGDEAALVALEERVPMASDERTKAAIEEGNALRARWRHYSGGMFRYGGEWYWGVDRLHHLERRLARYGALRPGRTDGPRFDRPPLDAGSVANAGRLRLEIYPSLRSPYTAMIFDRSIALAESVDVPVDLLPVMPMVMRGVPAPGEKGIYIMTDAIREAEHLGVPFGDMFDPIGEPVLRGFSLWPFARDAGHGAEYLSSFLRAAFAEGRRTGTDEGLRFVVERAGLDWSEAQTHLDRDAWRAELEENRQTMYEELGVWGVPSYRLLDAEGHTLLSVWGQDRLWLVAAEIRRHLA